MALALCGKRYPEIAVVVFVIVAEVFIGNFVAIVVAYEVSINKINSPPQAAPPAPVPIHSCLSSLAAAAAIHLPLQSISSQRTSMVSSDNTSGVKNTYIDFGGQPLSDERSARLPAPTESLLRRVHLLVLQREYDFAHPRALVDRLASTLASSVGVKADDMEPTCKRHWMTRPHMHRRWPGCDRASGAGAAQLQAEKTEELRDSAVRHAYEQGDAVVKDGSGSSNLVTNQCLATL